MNYYFRESYPSIYLDPNKDKVGIRKEDIKLAIRGLSQLKEVNYPISNERYSEETLQFLRRIRNIENYIGICGGGNQNLTILSCLQESNESFKVKLVDDSPAQIENFYSIAMIFSNSSTTAEYQENLKHWQSKRFPRDMVEKSRFHYQQLPIIKNGLNIDFHVSDISYYLRNVISEGRHFIYLSNVFGYDADRLKVPLNIISEDNRFRNSSVVMSVDTRSIIRHDDTVGVSFFEKKGLGFVNHEYKMPAIANLRKVKR